jgi:asparagine synthase (glutamine-hydrolysing)
VPASIVDRDKKALQYGSLVARELDRMARQAGFKRRLNDHVRKYVESITGE